jgi:phosphotransferase system HPr-like phosphotransfer protein
MSEAKELVNISSKLEGQITLQSGNKFAVNAKSLLGVLLAKKLNWDDLRIVMDNDYYYEYRKFMKS